MSIRGCANKGKHTHTCRHLCVRVFEEWMPIYNAHLHRRQMSKVHCGTPLTSNVTNNFFLQLHCSNPFSGLWNGNIITFLWCRTYDKTAACRAEWLTELEVLFALLFASLNSPLRVSCFYSRLFFCFFLPPNHLQRFILSLSRPRRYCCG